MSDTGNALLSVDGISRHYPINRGPFARTGLLKAVDGVSFSLRKGETLGLIGESGSGKSTIGRIALGMDSPSSGTVAFAGAPLPKAGTAAWRSLRARMQMIFQDPLGALDRRLTIADQIAEPLEIHDLGDRTSRRERVANLLSDVGLSAAIGERYPHQLSGGQRQRAVLARALATGPDLLVCDEPVSALDVSIQAQVVNLLQDIQARTGLTMLFISHDLRIVRHVSQRLIVLYLGQIVEMGDAETLFAGPRHPYTRALASAVPDPRRPAARDRVMLKGEPPDPSARPQGCVFHPRCPLAVPTCRSIAPVLQSLGPDHAVACHRLDAEAMPQTEGEVR